MIMSGPYFDRVIKSNCVAIKKMPKCFIFLVSFGGNFWRRLKMWYPFFDSRGNARIIFFFSNNMAKTIAKCSMLYRVEITCLCPLVRGCGAGTSILIFEKF